MSEIEIEPYYSLLACRNLNKTSEQGMECLISSTKKSRLFRKNAQKSVILASNHKEGKGQSHAYRTRSFDLEKKVR